MSDMRGDGKRDDVHQRARKMAEEGLRQESAGHDAEADALLEAAMQDDPDAVAEVLHETGADTAPDARDNRSDRHVAPPDSLRQPR